MEVIDWKKISKTDKVALVKAVWKRHLSARGIALAHSVMPA